MVKKGMTLKEVKDKYFPNRTLEELRGCSCKHCAYHRSRDIFKLIPKDKEEE